MAFSQPRNGVEMDSNDLLIILSIKSISLSLLSKSFFSFPVAGWALCTEFAPRPCDLHLVQSHKER